VNPFLALAPLIESGRMTHRDATVYGMLIAMVGAGQSPTLADVGRILNARADRHKSARRALRKLESLGLVRRENPPGVPMRIVVHLPAAG
jgi:predicted transcriptional regulator